MSIPRPILWLFLFGLLIFAYAKSFTGEPIWDDLHFIFWRFESGHYDHWRYWRFHIWPLFDSTVAIFYQFFKQNTLAWHSLNFGLHVLNGLLLGSLVRKFNRAWATPLMLLFWFHPLNVMSVAWIVQLKTVMCGFFILLTCHLTIHWWKKRKTVWYLSSLGAFALALFAKSAALPFPWLALGWAIFRKKFNRRLLLALLPFLALTGWSTWRIRSNSMVQENVSKAEEVVAQQVQTATEATPPAPAEPAPPIELSAPTVVSMEPEGNTAPAVEEAPTVQVPEAPAPVDEPIAPPSRLQVVAYALGSYLGYTFYPWPLTPVHGAYLGGWDWQSAAGYIVSLAFILWGFLKRSRLPLGLVAAQAGALVPFLGFIVAPYMTYTTVSEQHYYLVLPFTLALQLWVLSQLPQKFMQGVLVVMGLSFVFLSNDYARAFQNEITFYERIRHFRPEDRLAALNLAGHYGHNGQAEIALRIVNKALREAEQSAVLRQDVLHPSLLRARDVYELSPR